MKDKIKKLFNEKKIKYEWTGSLKHEDCVVFESDEFIEKRFHFYIPKMTWEGIEDVFVKYIIEFIENNQLHLAK